MINRPMLVRCFIASLSQFSTHRSIFRQILSAGGRCNLLQFLVVSSIAMKGHIAPFLYPMFETNLEWARARTHAFSQLLVFDPSSSYQWPVEGFSVLVADQGLHHVEALQRRSRTVAKQIGNEFNAKFVIRSSLSLVIMKAAVFGINLCAEHLDD